MSILTRIKETISKEKPDYSDMEENPEKKISEPRMKTTLQATAEGTGIAIGRGLARTYQAGKTALQKKYGVTGRKERIRTYREQTKEWKAKYQLEKSKQKYEKIKGSTPQGYDYLVGKKTEFGNKQSLNESGYDWLTGKGKKKQNGGLKWLTGR